MMKESKKEYINSINSFLEYIENEKFVYIQTHNYPDHDAVAAAYGLQYVLSRFNIKSQIIFDGSIQRDSLQLLITKLRISLTHVGILNIKDDEKIIIVDGCKGNRNVTDLPGTIIGVIDHHNVGEPEDVDYCDIRSDYGSCSTIILHYIRELNLRLPRNVATALMVGINMDTASLTRGVHPRDLEAFYYCFNNANISFVNYMMRNYLKLNDIKYYKYLIDNMDIIHNIAWCYFPNGCKQNLLGILSDYVISIEEIDFVVLCAKNKDRINFSLRNEKKEWDASVVIRRLLDNVGFGGGHHNMAGGAIYDHKNFDERKIKSKIVDILKNKSALIGT